MRREAKGTEEEEERPESACKEGGRDWRKGKEKSGTKREERRELGEGERVHGLGLPRDVLCVGRERVESDLLREGNLCVRGQS